MKMSKSGYNQRKIPKNQGEFWTLKKFAIAGLFIVAFTIFNGCDNQEKPKDVNLCGYVNSIMDQENTNFYLKPIKDENGNIVKYEEIPGNGLPEGYDIHNPTPQEKICIPPKKGKDGNLYGGTTYNFISNDKTREIVIQPTRPK